MATLPIYSVLERMSDQALVTLRFLLY